MTRPRLLDLYSGAGGAAWGYHLAGFDVTGVDHRPMPNYPFPESRRAQVLGRRPNPAELPVICADSISEGVRYGFSIASQRVRSRDRPPRSVVATAGYHPPNASTT